MDKEGRVLLFNEVAKKLSGTLLIKPFQEGSPLIDSINLETSLIVKDLIEEVQLTKLPEKHFTEFRNHNGTMVSLEFNFVPVINADGVETHIHLLIRDITSQRVFEKKLISQASYITNLIEKANAIIIGLDTRGYITDWNEHCLTVTGFTKDDVYAQKFTKVLMSNMVHEEFDKILERALNYEATVNQELMVRTHKGNLITLLLSSTPSISSSEQVVGLTLVGHDVTELAEYRITLEMKIEERTHELKRALRKEQEIVKMKSRFVSIASHEFRSPLSSIQFQTNFIKQNKKLISHSNLEKRLDLIEGHIQRMGIFLDDVLTYGKSEEYRTQLVISQIVLSGFLNKIVEEVSHYTKKEVSFIKTDYALVSTIFTSDEKLLRSILINLLTNAIKFSPGAESVYLSARDTGNHLVIKVRDEGIGIPDDEINKIFEPFLRGKSVVSIQGAGLGLSIVKKSVELLNGTIRIKSQVGIGTIFTVTIPTHQELPVPK